MLIAIEGIDNTGKTTLAGALAARLRTEGYFVGEHREPGRGPVGSFFRTTSTTLDPLPPRALAFLSTAARHAEQPILHRMLSACDVVVSDRYYLSGLAYHAADGIPGPEYQSWNRGITHPDVYLLLHAEAATRAHRAGQKPDGYWESAEITERLPDAYATCVDLIRHSENARVIALDAEPEPEQVLDQALAALAPVLEGIPS